MQGCGLDAASARFGADAEKAWWIMKKRSIRIFIYIVSALTAALTLSACSGGVYQSLMSALGFDMNDYEGEGAIRVIGSDDEAYSGIVKMIGILTIDSAHIGTFESPREAAAANRDAILNYMLSTGYAGYSGNSELLARASEEYPQYNITTLIPEGDLASTVYRWFGGDSSVLHEDSLRYIYLSRVNAYTTTGQPLPVTVAVRINNCVETEHTYRVFFVLTDENGESASYSAMIMKREDETMYMRYLRDEE